MKQQLIITSVAGASILLAVGLTSANMETAQENMPVSKSSPRIQVSSVLVNAEQVQAQVSAYGNASARYQLSLSSEVSGRVSSLSARFNNGLTVSQGEQLLALDDTVYQQNLASARADVSQAKVELLQEELNRKQAQQEWRRSGLSGQPDSELVLRGPQLQAARDKLDKTRSSLTKARYDLSNTRIVAPFSAVVINRQVQPGSFIQPGSQIATLYSTDVVDIKLPLSQKQWQQLPPAMEMIEQGWPVSLTSQDGSQHWQGLVSRVEQHINADNRQRALIVSVDQPLQQNPPLYPGTFVKALIPGATLNDIWRLPASSLSQEQTIWTIQQNTLVSHPAQVLFANGDSVFIKALSEKAEVLKQPLKSYFPGMLVNAKSATDKGSESAATSVAGE